MNKLEILSLPQIAFAHIFKSNTYINALNIQQNLLEISYIAEGNTTTQIGNKKYYTQKGDVLCLFHDSPTKIWANSFHCHHTVGALIDFKDSQVETSSLLLPIHISHEKKTTDICHSIDKIIAKQFLYKSSPIRGSIQFLELLCTIDECVRKSMAPSLPSEEFYSQRAKDFIQKKIFLPITQKEVAEHLGISPGYLCSIFKKTEGKTVMQYINTLKLESIKMLMDKENAYLYEAAEIYGYNDPNYVSRLYKQLFGHNITDKPLIHPDMK